MAERLYCLVSMTVPDSDPVQLTVANVPVMTVPLTCPSRAAGTRRAATRRRPDVDRTALGMGYAGRGGGANERLVVMSKNEP